MLESSTSRQLVPLPAVPLSFTACAPTPQVGLLSEPGPAGRWIPGVEALLRALRPDLELVRVADPTPGGPDGWPEGCELLLLASGRGERRQRLRGSIGPVTTLRPLRPDHPGGAPDLMLVGAQDHEPGVLRPGAWATREPLARVARLAFRLAMTRPRRQVTVVHEAARRPESCGLLRETALGIGRHFPGVLVDEVGLEDAAAALATGPGRFDVILASGLFVDCLGAQLASLRGGECRQAVADLGESRALFSPALEGPTSPSAGSPVGLLRAAGMLLDHMGDSRSAERLEQALLEALGLGSGAGDELLAAVAAALS